MNKREEAQLQSLKKDLQLATAMHLTEKVDPQWPIGSFTTPEPIVGYTFNIHKALEENSKPQVEVAACRSGMHAIGSEIEGLPKRYVQGEVDIYLDRSAALKALRHDLERRFAEKLLMLDREIEFEVRSGN